MSSPHWDDCWRAHLACAVARCERLEAEATGLEALVTEVRAEMAEASSMMAEWKDMADLRDAELAAVAYEMLLPAMRSMLQTADRLGVPDAAIGARDGLALCVAFFEERYKP